MTDQLPPKIPCLTFSPSFIYISPVGLFPLRISTIIDKFHGWHYFVVFDKKVVLQFKITSTKGIIKDVNIFKIHFDSDFKVLASNGRG